MEHSIELSPEYRKLIKRNETLREELCNLIADRDHLLSTVRPNLQADYQIKIGKKRYEALVLKIKVLRNKRKIELIQASMNKQESVCIEEIEEQLDQEFIAWSKKLEEHLGNIKAAERRVGLPHLSLEEAVRLKALYRSLAFKYHPDVNPDQSEEEKGFWLRICEAYQNGDLEELKTLDMLSSKGKLVDANSKTMGQIKEENAWYEERIESAIDAIGKMRVQFPFELEDKLKDEEWVKVQNSAMDKEIEGWEGANVVYAEKLAQLAFLIEVELPDDHAH